MHDGYGDTTARRIGDSLQVSILCRTQKGQVEDTCYFNGSWEMMLNSSPEFSLRKAALARLEPYTSVYMCPKELDMHGRVICGCARFCAQGLSVRSMLSMDLFKGWDFAW